MILPLDTPWHRLYYHGPFGAVTLGGRPAWSGSLEMKVVSLSFVFSVGPVLLFPPPPPAIRLTFRNLVRASPSCAATSAGRKRPIPQARCFRTRKFHSLTTTPSPALQASSRAAIVVFGVQISAEKARIQPITSQIEKIRGSRTPQRSAVAQVQEKSERQRSPEQRPCPGVLQLPELRNGPFA